MAGTNLMRRLAICAAPLCMVLAAPAAAQYADNGIHAGTIELPQNKSQVITADREIARAMIGNPEIADIVPLTDQSIYVLGKEMGTTSLTLYDRQGRVLSVMDVSVGPDVEAFRNQMAALLPGTNIDAHISGSSMVLTGLVNDAGALSRAVQLAETYAGDDVVNLVGLGSSQQVMLEVRFAEVRREIGQDIGVRGFGASDSGNFNSVFGSGSSLRPNPADGTALLEAGSVLNTFGVLGGAFGALGLNFEAYLNALEQHGFAKTLAEPTLVAISGQRADFLAGGEFPVPVVQSGGGEDGIGRVTVEFKPFGVSLGFTPTVLGDNTINLIVEPEVSSIDPAASIQLNGISIPGLQTRRASTTVELRDGESFAIAGLLQENFQTNVNQLPLLGNIPILGALFRSTEYQRGETELLIVVTPRLVQPIRPDQVVLPTDRVEDPDRAEVVLFGDGYNPVPADELNPSSAGSDQEVGDYEF